MRRDAVLVLMNNVPQSTYCMLCCIPLHTLNITALRWLLQVQAHMPLAIGTNLLLDEVRRYVGVAVNSPADVVDAMLDMVLNPVWLLVEEVLTAQIKGILESVLHYKVLENV